MIAESLRAATAATVAFLDFSFGELFVVGIVALLLFGGRLPEMMRTLGVSYRNLRRGLDDLKRQAMNGERPTPPRPPYEPRPPSEPDAATSRSAEPPSSAPGPSPTGSPQATNAAPSTSAESRGDPEPAGGPAPSDRARPPAPSRLDDDLPLV